MRGLLSQMMKVSQGWRRIAGFKKASRRRHIAFRPAAAYEMLPAGNSFGSASQMITRLRRTMRRQSLPLVIGFAVLALIVGSRAMLVEGQRANRAAARAA